MTGWADVVLSEVFGGVSEVLGSPFPQTPSPHDAVSSVPIISTDQLTPLDRAKLTYMGIDPDSAGLDQINRALGRDQPLSVPPPAAPPPRPTTPAATPPNPDSPELRGAAAEAAKRLDEALARNHSAINDADDQLADAVLKASSSSAEGHQRLQRLQQEIIDEIDKLGSSLDTPAGQQQLAEFLQGKTGDILNVLKNAGLDSDSQARVLDGLSARYRGLHHDAGSDETPASDGQPQDATTSSGDAPPSTGDGGEDGLPAADPLLDGLASDPLLSGLGIMAGPAMGALGSLPGALGSAIPSLGGGGLGGAGLGDLAPPSAAPYTTAQRLPSWTPTSTLNLSPRPPKATPKTTSRPIQPNRRVWPTTVATIRSWAIATTPRHRPSHWRHQRRSSCLINRCEPPVVALWPRRAERCSPARTSTMLTLPPKSSYPHRVRPLAHRFPRAGCSSAMWVNTPTIGSWH